MTSYPRQRSRQEREIKEQYKRFEANGTRTYPEAIVPTVSVLTNDEVCSDEIHTEYPKEGGPFCVRKITYTPGSLGTGAKAGYNYTRVSSGITTYWASLQQDGTVFAPPAGAALPSETNAIDATKAYGAEAWNRFSPKPYVTNLGQFFGELHESFQMLWNVRRLASPEKLEMLRFLQRSVKEMRYANLRSMSSWPIVWRYLRRLVGSLADGYLALEFGWKPFVQDFSRFIRSLDNYDKRLAKIQKENGQWVKRGGTLRNVNSPKVTSNIYNGLKHYTFIASHWKTPTYFYETRSSEKVWFQGRFRVFIPGLDDQSFIGKADRLRRLYGVEVTPWLIWKLTPWSWMADWFINIDHILGNLSDISTHHLIAKYAYIMRSTTVTRDMIYRVVGEVQSEYLKPYVQMGPTYALSTTTVSTKTRCAASPFGFSLDWPDFDNWRLSILAALGLSRVL